MCLFLMITCVLVEIKRKSKILKSSDASMSAMLKSPALFRARVGLDVTSSLNARCLSQKLATRYGTRVPEEKAHKC